MVFLTPQALIASDLAGQCAEVHLLKTSSLIASAPCFKWVESVWGRVHRVNGASGAIWSVNTGFGTGLSLTARHVFGDAPEIPTSEIPSFLGLPGDPTLANPFIFLPNLRGAQTDRLRNQAFRLFSPAVPPNGYVDHYALISPADDFVISVVTARKLAEDQVSFSPPDQSPLSINDPLNLAFSMPTYDDPVSGSLVIILGYPQDAAYSGELTYSVGQVLTSTEAKRLIQRDPEESKVPFDENVEFVIRARNLSGMSGGGSFNREGRYLGPIIRGNDEAADGIYFTRVVRMSHILKKLNQAVHDSPLEFQEKLKLWLESK